MSYSSNKKHRIMEALPKKTNYQKEGSSRKARSNPSYWGYYEYNNQIKDVRYDPEIDVKNHKKVKGFIRKWVEKHLDGIQLHHRQQSCAS